MKAEKHSSLEESCSYWLANHPKADKRSKAYSRTSDPSLPADRQGIALDSLSAPACPARPEGGRLAGTSRR
jgi:hypothetical protein